MIFKWTDIILLLSAALMSYQVFRAENLVTAAVITMLISCLIIDMYMDRARLGIIETQTEIIKILSKRIDIIESIFKGAR